MSPRLSTRKPGVYRVSDADVAILEELNSEIMSSIYAHAPYHAKWRECWEYMKGNHYVRVDEDLVIKVVPQDDPSAIRMVKNLFGSSVRIAVSKLLANKLEPECLPNAKSENAYEMARLQESVLSGIGDVLHLEQNVLAPCVRNFFLTGRMVAKVVWQDFPQIAAGPEARTGDTVSLLTEPATLGGFPVVYPVHPERILVAPWAQPYNIPWVIEVHVLPRDEVDLKYGKDANVGAERPDVLPLYMASMPTERMVSQKYLEKLCVIYEYWEPANKKYKNGRYYVFSKTKILVKRDSDTPKDDELPILELPYVILTDPIMSETLMCGIGSASDAIPLQKATNLALSQQIDAVNKNLNPPIMAAENSSADTETMMGYKLVRIPAGQVPPKFMEMPRYPQEGFQLEALLSQSILDVFGVHDVTAGQAGGATSGRMVGYLADLDAVKFGLPAQALIELYVGICKLILKALKSHAAAPMLLRVMGDGNDWEIKSFYADKQQSFNVKIKAIPGYMQGKGELQQMALQAAQLGAIKPEELRSILGFSSMNQSFEVEEMYQQREIDKVVESVLAGHPIVPVPMALENHEVAVAVCKRFIVSEKLDAYPQQVADQVRIIVEEHAFAHYAYWLRAQQNPASLIQQPPGPATAPFAQGEQPQDGGDQAATPGDPLNPSMIGAPPQMMTADAGGQHTEEMTSRRPVGDVGNATQSQPTVGAIFPRQAP